MSMIMGWWDYGVHTVQGIFDLRDISGYATMIAALSSPASGEPQGKLCSGDDAPNMVTTAVLQ